MKKTPNPSAGKKTLRPKETQSDYQRSASFCGHLSLFQLFGFFVAVVAPLQDLYRSLVWGGALVGGMGSPLFPLQQMFVGRFQPLKSEQ